MERACLERLRPLLGYDRLVGRVVSVELPSFKVGMDRHNKGKTICQRPLNSCIIQFYSRRWFPCSHSIQGMWAFLHLFSLMPPPYPMGSVPLPFGVPLIIDLCFWGGVWGAAFGLILPSLSGKYPLWVSGFGLGIAAALVGRSSSPLLRDCRGRRLGGYGVCALTSDQRVLGIHVGLLLPLIGDKPIGTGLRPPSR